MTNTSKVGKTTFSLPSDRELVAMRDVNAPRELVFEAHTKPDYVARWMTGPDEWSMPVCEIDLRPGGSWHFVWQKATGDKMEMRGVYKEISAPSRLMNTEAWGGDWPETLHTLILTGDEDKTTITTKVLYPSKEARDRALDTGMKEGWSQSYERLERILPNLAKPSATRQTATSAR